MQTDPVPDTERRRASRIPAGRIRVLLRTWHPEREDGLTKGEGLLSDLGPGGFRIEQLAWDRPLSPSYGTDFAFEIRGGKLSGVSGIACIAWSAPGMETLGARLQRLNQDSAWGTWAAAARAPGRTDLAP